MADLIYLIDEPEPLRSVLRRWKKMDFWMVVMGVAVLMGLNGWWVTTLLVNGVVYYSLWEEGLPFDFGFEMGTIIAIPFAWMFALTEIALTYFNK